jgi:glycosyltransferase involved in cell wall biosynthesis
MSQAYSRVHRRVDRGHARSTQQTLPYRLNGYRSSHHGLVSVERRNGPGGHLRPRYERVTGKPLSSSLPLYPLDMSPLLALSEDHLDQQGILCFANPAASNNTLSSIYHPSNIAQYALAHWNAYLLKGHEAHREAFLQQVDWLLTHEVHRSGDVGVWPVPFAVPEYYAPHPWASASVQGYVISALIRAYQLTGSELFLQATRRAVGAFRLDILDGGVAAPIGEDGIFFEEVAVYPAAHILNGCILALLGLYDYVAVTQDGRVDLLIERCLSTLHTLLNYFDTGYWSRYDLLSARPVSEFYHTLHITLLRILGSYTGCEHCLALAARWERYAHNPLCYLRYWLVSHLMNWWNEKFKPWLRVRLFGSFETMQAAHPSSPRRVCVPLPSLPDAERIHDTLVSVSRVMEPQWQMSYLIQHVGKVGKVNPTAQQPAAKQPGTRFHPWHFPGILLYCWHGGLHLFHLLRQGERYHLLLPQDGIVCAAFAGLLGKLVGARVVCMDSGSLLWCRNQAAGKQHTTQPASTAPCSWPDALFYRPSLRLLAAIASHCCDQFLLANDEVAEIYRLHLKVRPDRILQAGLLVDMTRFAAQDQKAKLRLRIGRGLSPGLVLIALAHRPTLSKDVRSDMRIALGGVVQALRALPPHVRTRVRVLIATEQTTHAQVMSEILRYRLTDVCWLWGEAGSEEATQLFSMADIFLSIGSRGADDMLTVLEAMAAGCAVVATRTSPSNTKLLAEGRGIGVLPDSPTEIGIALADLCKDLDLCRHMGRKAREYVARHHSIQMLQRNLLRASFFAPSLPSNTL